MAMNRMRWIKVLLAMSCLGVGVVIGANWSMNATGAGVTPGSIDDPVVTKSYVDNLLGGGSDAKRELEALMESFRKEIESGGSTATSEVVIVKPGEILFAAPGTQFVLRAGAGVAYSSDENGISDVTAGQDIKSGKPVANNHLLLFPREGRGVMPDPARNVNLTVLAIGEYEIASQGNKAE